MAAIVEDDPSASDDDRSLCRQYRWRYKGIPCADPLQGDPQGAVHDDPSPDGEKIKMDGHNLSHETLRSTNVYMTAYFIVLFVSLLIVCLDEYDLSTNFTAVLATLNNIGPGLELVGPTPELRIVQSSVQMRADVRYAGRTTGTLPHARDPAAVLLEEILIP